MTKTIFQIKQQLIQQLHLSLTWSKKAMNENYNTLSDSDIEELNQIRRDIKLIIKNIDTDFYKV